MVKIAFLHRIHKGVVICLAFSVTGDDVANVVIEI